MRQQSLTRILPYLRPFRWHIVFIVVSAFVSIGAQLAIPLVAKAIIDGPIRNHDRAAIWPLFALAAGLAFVEIFLTQRRRTELARMATGVDTQLRNELYEKLQALDVGFHDTW